jgi:ABC-type antimicrobial peptide transport system permease subunit
VVHAQASTVALVALVGGVPLGIVLGRLVFHFFAGELGLVPDPTMPLLLIAGIAIAVLVIANLAAAIPGWRAARIPVAALLRAE